MLARSDPLWAVLADPSKKGGGWSDEEFLRTGEQQVSEIADWLAELGCRFGGERALDFGCGAGRLTQALANYFRQVVGVDISSEMIEVARRINRRGQRCIFRTLASPDLREFPDDHCDGILTLITLQHVDPVYTARYLKAFIRILKPNGHLVFQLTSHRKTEHPAPPHSGHSPGSPVRRAKDLYWRTVEVLQNLQQLWRNFLRIRKGSAFIPMYGIPEYEVRQIIRQAGGEIRAVRPDNLAGPEWFSYTYCATKNPLIG